jgi:hypothetical protein|tara:strand:+ start:657 stop:827 length:171 start_codon:yes stop_codon:yes gene_type:complete
MKLSANGVDIIIDNLSDEDNEVSIMVGNETGRKYIYLGKEAVAQIIEHLDGIEFQE